MFCGTITCNDESIEALGQSMQALTMVEDAQCTIYDLIFERAMLEDVCSFGQVNSICANRALVEVQRRGYSWLRKDVERSGFEIAKHLHNVRIGLKEGQKCLLDFLNAKIFAPLPPCKTLEEALLNKELISTIKEITISLVLGKFDILLPPELEQFTALEEFTCSGGIAWGKLRMISPVITKCQQLKKLSFPCNKLTTIPSYISTCSQLVELCLSNNRLSGIPSELSKCENLRAIYLMGNPLDKEFQDFADEFFRGVHIKTEFDRLHWAFRHLE